MPGWAPCTVGMKETETDTSTGHARLAFAVVLFIWRKGHPHIVVTKVLYMKPIYSYRLKVRNMVVNAQQRFAFFYVTEHKALSSAIKDGSIW